MKITNLEVLDMQSLTMFDIEDGECFVFLEEPNVLYMKLEDRYCCIADGYLYDECDTRPVVPVEVELKVIGIGNSNNNANEDYLVTSYN